MSDAASSSSGVPVGIPLEDAAWAEKYAKHKVRAKYYNSGVSALATFVAGKALWESEATNCNPLLVRVVMGWVAVLGLLLLLAELGVPLVLNYVHVLSYRTARAGLGIMVGTICGAAAPSELPVATAGYAMREGYYVREFKWEFALVGVMMIGGALYNLRLTLRSKAHQLGGRNKLATGRGSDEKELL